MNTQGGTQTYFPWGDGQRPLEVPAENQAPLTPIKGYFPDQDPQPINPEMKP